MKVSYTMIGEQHNCFIRAGLILCSSCGSESRGLQSQTIILQKKLNLHHTGLRVVFIDP